MAGRHGSLAAVFLAFGLATPAAALEYCVTCEGPPAMYRCVVDGTKDGKGNDPGVSLFCISQMAKQGGHETCAVSRGAPFPCPGLTALVQPPANTAQPEGPPPDDVYAAEQPHELDAVAIEPKVEAQPAKVPRTMEELAGQTVKSSKEGLQKAGEAIGGGAKKAGEQIGTAGSAVGNAVSTTWSCITSLFTSCGSGNAEKAAAGTPEQQ